MIVFQGCGHFFLLYLCISIKSISIGSALRTRRRNHSTLKFYHVPYRIVYTETNNYLPNLDTSNDYFILLNVFDRRRNHSAARELIERRFMNDPLSMLVEKHYSSTYGQ